MYLIDEKEADFIEICLDYYLLNQKQFVTDREQHRTAVIARSVMSKVRISDAGEVSDGYHTFNQLYHQRAMLFAALVKANKDRSWKTHRHEDGQLCFGGGWFLVTIETPEGAYGYHYEDKYWDLFECQEIYCGKHWDGYTEADVTRLLSL